jgi:hypothetical protein
MDIKQNKVNQCTGRKNIEKSGKINWYKHLEENPLAIIH